MNGIVGSSTLLADTKLDEDQRRLLNTILKCGEHLLQLVSDILLMSKLAAESQHSIYDLREAPFSLTSCLSSLLDMYELTMRQKKVVLRLDLPAEAILITADEGRIRQVVVNLISNAIKFTERGEIVVKASLLRDSSSGQMQCELSVRDTGFGMKDIDLEQIFQPFQQLDTPLKSFGAGLGLSIVKNLVTALKGSIQVKSKLGKGTTFVVRIPVHPYKTPVTTPATSQAPTPEPQQQQHHDKIKILIVEDNPVNMEITKRHLKRHGYDAFEATSGEDALDTAKHKRFDLIFMDISMPGINGMETTQIIRRSPNLYPGYPYICALTANAMEGDRETYLRAGMNDYISKPFKPDDLLRVIKSAEARSQR